MRIGRMQRLARVAAVSISGACLLAGSPIPAAASPAPSHPPVAPVHDVTDDYFGTRITDPYRWMESEPKPQFFDYLHAENDYARAVLARIPGRDKLAADIDSVTGLAARVRSVDLTDGRIFFMRRDAGAQITDVCRDGEPVVRLCHVKGLDHAWAGGDEAVPFHAAVGPDASAMIWDFFETQRRTVAT